MAEEEKPKQEGDKEAPAKDEADAKKEEISKKEEEYESLVRIISYDIPGTKQLLAGLTRIKGVSWNLAKAICKKVKIDPSKKVSELSEEEIKKIEEYIKQPDIPAFLKNRQKDLESGEDVHLHGTDLDLRKEFDIKKLRKIKSLRGLRHAAKLPVRGQRTRANFRSKGKAVGVRRKSK